MKKQSLYDFIKTSINSKFTDQKKCYILKRWVLEDYYKYESLFKFKSHKSHCDFIFLQLSRVGYLSNLGGGLFEIIKLIPVSLSSFQLRIKYNETVKSR